MKISLSVLSVLSAAGASLSRSDPVTELFQRCEKGGPNAYVGVRYQGGLLKTFNYDECFPYEISGKVAEMAVFCKSVTCYNNPYSDCTGGEVPPVPVPVLAGLTLDNAADFAQLIGQGARCEANRLPLI